jgi:hypothetical protein
VGKAQVKKSGKAKGESVDKAFSFDLVQEINS